MAEKHNFEHLPLVLRKDGPARFAAAPQPPDPITADNKQNRASHSGSLMTQATSIAADWMSRQSTREESGLPAIQSGIPLLLKIDTSLDLENLSHFFAFEIVSEQEDGFVIVASEDSDLRGFQQKLNDFTNGVRGSTNIAQIHELVKDHTQNERLKRVLSEVLFAEWPNLQEDAPYTVDISIACVGNWQIPNKPKRGRRTDQKWAEVEAAWSALRADAYQSVGAQRDLCD